MKFSTAAAFVATFLSAVIFAPADAVEENTGLRHLMGKKGRRSRNDMMMGGQGMEDKSSMMMGGGSDSGDASMFNLLVTNLAYQQPLSPFFVLVHSSETMPLFKYGMRASPQLAQLAEDGNPASLVELYEDMDGVCEAKVSSKQAHKLVNGKILRCFAYMHSVFTYFLLCTLLTFNMQAFADENAPYMAGDTASIPVTLGNGCDYVTIASMAINTNDCFVALNSVKIGKGEEYYLNGLDSGSEANDELCANIPGPACAMDSGNGSTDGEGFVHVHRGFHGVGNLAAANYDWRNPMARVYVEEA